MEKQKNSLRRIRRDRDITQKRLADISGVDSTTISRYENGTITPGIENLLKLSKALNCTIDELVRE